jgi:hypothetical protein
MFIEEAADPLGSTITLTDTSPEFTQKYLSSFREALPEDESKAVLQDRLDTGWLVWGREMEVSRMPAWDEIAMEMDEGCRPGVNLIEEATRGEAFWRSVSAVVISLEHRAIAAATNRVTCLTSSRSQITGRKKTIERTLPQRISTSSSPQSRFTVYRSSTASNPSSKATYPKWIPPKCTTGTRLEQCGNSSRV